MNGKEDNSEEKKIAVQIWITQEEADGVREATMVDALATATRIAVRRAIEQHKRQQQA